MRHCKDCKYCLKVPFDFRCKLDRTKRVWPLSTEACEKFEPKEPIKRSSDPCDLAFAQMQYNASYSGMHGIIG